MLNILALFPSDGQSIGFDIISIIFIVIVAIFFVIYIAKGFVAGLFALLTGLGSIALAALLASSAGNWIFNLGLGDVIKNGISSWTSSSLGDMGNLPVNAENIAQALEALKIPSFIAEPLGNLMVSFGENGATLNEAISSSLAQYACIAIAFIVLWVIFFIVFKIIAHFLKKISHIPVLGIINRILGGVFGLAVGLLICFVACTVIQMITSLDGNIANSINDLMKLNDGDVWSFGKALYENNPIQMIIDQFLPK